MKGLSFVLTTGPDGEDRLHVEGIAVDNIIRLARIEMALLKAVGTMKCSATVDGCKDIHFKCGLGDVIRAVLASFMEVV